MKQGDCRGEPRGCCGWEGWAQAGAQTVGWACRLWDRTLQRWEAQTSIFAFLKVFRKAAGQGHVVPPHGCPRGPCIPPGGLPCLQPALPALPTACLACCLHTEPSSCRGSLGTGGSPGAHHAAWVGASHALRIRAEMDPDLDVLFLLCYKCLPQGIISGRELC